jgi:glycosyltransferase involved in cell wall biosynthesis
MEPKFSVIMPSRLIPYKGSASVLNKKIIRAVNSVLDQTFKDFELIVISDGCEETKKIVTTNFTDKRLRLLECHHKGLFDNLPRNTGIKEAKGEFIVYCDIDDFWGKRHLTIISEQLESWDWVWFNDIYFSAIWQERACSIKSKGGCGTSNVCHKRSLNLLWDRPGYAHDYYFAQKLLLNRNGTKINTPEYYVCHIPRKYDL